MKFIQMKNNQIKDQADKLKQLDDFVWVPKNEIKMLYSKIVEYENKIRLYKEMLKKNLINE